MTWPRVAIALSHHAVVSPRLRGDGIVHGRRQSQPGDGRCALAGSVITMAVVVVVVVVMGMATTKARGPL
jgi:hypothetical protein